MSVAIIGAGASGLAAARHVLNCGSKMDVFEMRSELGGTWVYTDDVGKDQYGYPVHSAMYRGLRLNMQQSIIANIIPSSRERAELGRSGSASQTELTMDELCVGFEELCFAGRNIESLEQKLRASP